MSEPEHVDPKQLRPGPIHHGPLPPELLEQIEAVFDVIGPYINMALEQFEIGFMWDMHLVPPHRVEGLRDPLPAAALVARGFEGHPALGARSVTRPVRHQVRDT